MMRRTIAKLDDRGFTLAEVLLASFVLVIALLSIVVLFPQGYQQVSDAGRLTLAVTSARQILEGIGALPFDSVLRLNGYTTANPATLPASGPELATARRWAYMVAGNTNGFNFTAGELAEYGSFTPFGGQASIQVTSLNGNLDQVTLTVSVPGLSTKVVLATVVVRLF